MSSIYTEIALELERRDFASFAAEDSHTFSDGFSQKMGIIISSFNRRKNTLARKTRLLLIAAVITVLIFGVLCTGAAYIKYTHRVTDCGISSFIRYDNDDYYDGHSDSTIPSCIHTYYAPSYIPDGYIIKDELNLEISYFIDYVYSANDNYRIHYKQHLLSSHFIVDTENAEVSYIKRNGIKYFCVAKNDTTYLSWTDNSYVFTLCIFGPLGTEDALKIAESLAAQ